MSGKYQLVKPNKTLVSTTEQEAIIDFAKHAKESMIVNALAGAAKTSTLEFICDQIRGIPILSLAFNKKIAVEMSERLPSHVLCKTMNGLGHGVWATAIGKRKMHLDDRKMFRLLKDVGKEFKGQEAKDFTEDFAEILRAVQRAKAFGYNPLDYGKTLFSSENFRATFDEPPARWHMGVIDNVLRLSTKEAYAGTIDFSDQIYMPTLFGGAWPAFPLVLVDEAQDLSPLNHAMLKLLVKKRLIAVGDPFQSIYGFRGAVTSGMEVMEKDFAAAPFPLSVSFRCPINIVRRARSRAPHMKWIAGAEEGKVVEVETWTAVDVPDGAAIICRNNAPLFKTALQLIRAGRGIKLIGFDIGPQLVKLLQKLGPNDMDQTEMHRAINKWETEALAKANKKGSISDKAECLRIFADSGDTLAGAVAYAEHLFKSTGPIELLSGHKSKGLEWDTVLHLDPWRIPGKFAETEEEIEQELNIKYVIETRAKKNLVLINSEGYRT